MGGVWGGVFVHDFKGHWVVYEVSFLYKISVREN